ncbi:MAG: hypothetical protein IT372_17170 [Polyangiaceae bacterium]|nr:hypothetical protein [Polyangiaceae bacterium]
MPRSKPRWPPDRPKVMFQRVLSGRSPGLRAWGSGPRYVLLCIAAGTIMAVASGRARPSSDGRKAALERAAELVNGPLGELAPFHARLKLQSSGETLLLDSQRDACIEAAPHVERLAGLSFPAEDGGKRVEAAEALQRAAGQFLERIKACRGGADAAALRADELPVCILQCSRGWSALASAAEKLREDAEWVGVRVEPLGPR